MIMKFEIKDIETGEPASHSQLLGLALRLICTGALGYFMYKYVDKLVNMMDPTKKQKMLSEEKVLFL